MRNKMLSTAVKQVSSFFLFAVFILLLIAIGPLLVIWSLNTLFSLGIAYSISTWFAALVLSSVLKARFKD
jgi:hypothetical protein